MGRINSTRMDQTCKKHPSHKLSQGVCPSCLKEKLIHVLASSSKSSNPSTVYHDSNSSTCSTLSPNSSCSSYCDSPDLRKMVKTKSFSCMLISNERRNKKQPLMKKSRSLAFVVEEKTVDGGQKKGGFWSRILRKNNKKACASDHERKLHSLKNIKERASSKWILF